MPLEMERCRAIANGRHRNLAILASACACDRDATPWAAAKQKRPLRYRVNPSRRTPILVTSAQSLTKANEGRSDGPIFTEHTLIKSLGPQKNLCGGTDLATGPCDSR